MGKVGFVTLLRPRAGWGILADNSWSTVWEPKAGGPKTSLGGLMTYFNIRACLSMAAAGVLLLGACASPSTDDALPSTDEPARASLAGAETTTDAQIDPEPTGEGPVPADAVDRTVSDACQAVVPASLTEVAQSADQGGTASFWASGRRWAVCDAASDGDASLLAEGRGRSAFGERTLALTAAPADGGMRYAAGGRVPWPVDRITYAFPDGQAAEARFVEADGATWWAASYTADTDLSSLDPVVVEVVGGAAEAFRLPW